jgi:hypothetical protein
MEEDPHHLDRDQNRLARIDRSLAKQDKEDLLWFAFPERH